MDNLSEAFRKARKGKRRRPDVARFSLDLERNLLALQRELAAGDYLPGAYRQFTVYERKPRLISVAPFRDRVSAVRSGVGPIQLFVSVQFICRIRLLFLLKTLFLPSKSMV